MMQTGMVKQGLNRSYQNSLEGRTPFLMPCFTAYCFLFYSNVSVSTEINVIVQVIHHMVHR